MDKIIEVFIENEKYSNQEFIYDDNNNNNNFCCTNMLEYPYFYPYSYGFIYDIYKKNNIKINAMIISDNILENNKSYSVYIIGSLILEYNNIIKEILLTVEENQYYYINNIHDLDNKIKNHINWFFSNYKKNIYDIKIYGLLNKQISINIYNNILNI